MPQLIILIATLLFPAAAFAQSESMTLKTVVIDAGHGGRDAGAISLDKKLREKDVVLDIALKLGGKIKEAYPDVKVMYTRSKDEFIPLDRRADIANKAHADLFISIHCNSVPAGKAAPSGCETFIMGTQKSQSNMEVCKIENSVILLEDDYTTKYEGFNPNDPQSYIFFNLMQNAYFEQSLIMADLCQKKLRSGPISKNRGVKQGGLLVLWKTTMPSILVELGFITNKNDKDILATKAGRERLAGSLLAAFEEFKLQYESGAVATAADAGSKAEPAARAEDSTRTGDNTRRMAEAAATEKPSMEKPSTDKASTEKANAEKTDAKRPAEQPSQATEAQQKPTLNVSNGYYSVQIFALSRRLPENSAEFKGEKDVHIIKTDNLYKYSIGTFSTPEEARKKAVALQKQFKGAFAVKIMDGKISKL